MKVDIKVPCGKSGDWAVEEMNLSEENVKLHNLYAAMHGDYRFVPAGNYKRLTYKNSVIMSNTPAECDDFLYFVNCYETKGNILINGLGLGVLLTALLEKPDVEHVTVIEISEDVIKLVGPTFAGDPRVTIIHADAFIWKLPKGVRYNAVWHDIWPTICEDNLPEMTKLHRKYGKRCDYQESWCRELCKR